MFESTAFDSTTGTAATLSISPDDGDIKRLKGELTIRLGDNASESDYLVETGDGAKCYPFKIRIEPDTKADIELLIQNEASNHHLKLTPESETDSRNTNTLNLSLPPLQVLRLGNEYLQTGLTTDLIKDVENTFKKSEEHQNLLEFISNLKKILHYNNYIKLLDDVAEKNNTAKSRLAKGRHSFFKNIVTWERTGHPYPVNSFNQLKRKIAEYESKPHLEEVELEDVIARLLDDMADGHRHSIGERISFEIPFVEFIGGLQELHFVQLLAASVKNEIDIPDRDFVEAYFEENDPSGRGPFALLRQEAYDSKPDPEIWEATLAYSLDHGEEEYNEACANFLYWYASKNDDFYFELTPKIYSAAKAKFDEWEDSPDHMTYLAAFWEHYYRGIILKQSDYYDAARESFKSAEEIAGRPVTGGRLEEYRPFVKRTLIEIETSLSKGEFSDATDAAETGQRHLQEVYKLSSQDYHYILLKAWEKDVRAQFQIRKGDFESALKITQEAASAFDEIDKNRLAQVARVREFQIKAFIAQTKKDFTKASTHHAKVDSEEFPDIPLQTKYFHEMQAKLCSVKSALTEGEIEEAETALEQLEDGYSRRTEVKNIRGLIDVYRDYLNGESTEVSRIIERFEIHDEDNGRFRPYHGDYLSSAFFISFAQELKVSDSEAKEKLNEMVTHAVEYAASGSELLDRGVDHFTHSSEQPDTSAEQEVYQLINKGENKQIEFKETLLYGVREDEHVKYLKRKAVEEICAFANADGGKLLIGVDDDKNIKGIKRDLEIADDLDDLKIRLSQEIVTRMGKGYAASYTEIDFVDIEDKTLCLVNVESSDDPIYYDDDKFLVRHGTSKRSLDTPQAVEYINKEMS